MALFDSALGIINWWRNNVILPISRSPIATIIKDILTPFESLYNVIVDLINQFVGMFTTQLWQILQFVTAVADGLNAIWSDIQNLASDWWNVQSTMISALWNALLNIPDFIAGIYDRIKQAFWYTYGNALDWLNKNMPWLGVIAGIPAGVWDFLTNGGLQNLIANVLNIPSELGSLRDSIINDLVGQNSPLQGLLNYTEHWVLQQLQKLVSQFTNEIVEFVEWAANIIIDYSGL
jgi:hypothetical protein